MLGALTQIYPATPQIECLFHLSMNVFKHVQELGFQQVYLNDQLFRTNIRMIPAAVSKILLLLLTNSPTIVVL